MTGHYLGLLYDVVRQSLVRQYGLIPLHRNLFYHSDPRPHGGDRIFVYNHKGAPHRHPVAREQGDVVVHEALEFQLDFRQDKLWFVIEPRVVVTTDGVQLAPIAQRKLVSSLVLSGRYNSHTHDILLFWLYYLSSRSSPICFWLPSLSGEPCARLVLDEHYAFSSPVGT